MAALAASVPLRLLLDSLLASSWTWVALSLATIATLLRALSRSCSIFCHRSQALLPPPPCTLSSETEQIASPTCKVLHRLSNTQERRSQSIPALESLLIQRPDALEVFPCMRGCNRAAPLLPWDAGFAPKILSGLPCSVREEASEGAFRLWSQVADNKQGLSLRKGFLADAPKIPEGEDGSSKPLWTSSDAYNSSCKHMQKSSFDIPLLSSEVPLCFEMQFGWHKVLDTRRGSSWRTHPARASLPCIHDKCVVKIWSTSQRNLFKALKVEESSVAALDVNIRCGFACSACRNGEVFRWDISSQACVSSAPFCVRPISALCLNSDKGVIVSGNGQFLRLWDHRSPSLFAPVLDGVNVSPFSALRCEGDLLQIDQINGNFSSCDLRKPQGKFLSIGAIADSVPVVTKAEEDELSVLWEKLSCDEDDFWDEYHIGYGDAVLQKRSSFVSRCATLMRSLSSSGR